MCDTITIEDIKEAWLSLSEKENSEGIFCFMGKIYRESELPHKFIEDHKKLFSDRKPNLWVTGFFKDLRRDE